MCIRDSITYDRINNEYYTLFVQYNYSAHVVSTECSIIYQCSCPMELKLTKSGDQRWFLSWRVNCACHDRSTRRTDYSQPRSWFFSTCLIDFPFRPLLLTRRYHGYRRILSYIRTQLSSRICDSSRHNAWRFCQSYILSTPNIWFFQCQSPWRDFPSHQ